MHRERSGLQLVKSRQRVDLSRADFCEPGTQGLLFPVPKRGAVLFVHLHSITDVEFKEILEIAAPAFVLDLRAAPRFDIGRFNRRLAFAAFERCNSVYIDLSGTTMGKEDTMEVLDNLRTFLKTNRPPFPRPVMFLADGSGGGNTLVGGVLDVMTRFGGTKVEVFELPCFETP